MHTKTSEFCCEFHNRFVYFAYFALHICVFAVKIPPTRLFRRIGGKQFYYTLLLFEAFLESVDLACKLLGELVAELSVVLTDALALVEP